MLILLCAVFFGIRSNKIMYEGTTTFGQDFRTGARTASFFALLVGAITYIYYTKIDVDFISIKKEKKITYYQENIENIVLDEGIKKIIESMPLEFQSEVNPIQNVFIKKIHSKLEDNKKIAKHIRSKGIIKSKQDLHNDIIVSNTIYSPISQTTYTLFGLVFLGLFHAGVFALLMRKYPGFKR